MLYVLGFSFKQIYLDGLVSHGNHVLNINGNVVFNGYLTTQYVYSHTLLKYFYVCIDDYITNTKDQILAFKKDAAISENVLARIQVNNSIFTINIDNNGDDIFKERNYFGNVKIRKLGVKLIDKYGDILDINNSEISLALEFTQRYSSKLQDEFNKLLIN
jgi:hypothetical protein